MRNSTWERFTNPQSIAIVGATEKAGSVGSSLVVNLTQGLYAGQVYPINPKRETVHGRTCYPGFSALPSPADLALIATPAAGVPDIIRECGENGTRAVVVLSAGFEEVGVDGHELGLRMVKEARRNNVRILGPNCVGIISPRHGLNATFASVMPKDGSVAFLSQSGALGTAILDWSIREKIGLSAFVSLGSMLDLGWSELIDYLGQDSKTQSIVMYMESIGDARAFLSAARELALTKPIIVLKAGRHAEGARAAMSHTGAMAGSDEVLDAAFDRCGILRVKTIAELFYMAEALSTQPRPKGRRLSIVTNAGGPGVLATDALIDEGGTLAELTPEMIQRFDAVLPASWSKNNPIDVLGDASPDRYRQALEIALSDPNTDAVLTILTPQSMTDPTETARATAAAQRPKDKPLLACWMGGDSVTEGQRILQSASIPTYPYPDTAARIARYMSKYSESLQNLYETPHRLENSESGESRREVAADILRQVKTSGRMLLTEYESKRLMKLYGINTVETSLANTATEAVEQANRIGFPVVLKLNSEIITHKAKAGGVCLDLDSESAVRQAFRSIEEAAFKYGGPKAFLGVTVQSMVRQQGCELIIGSRIDAQFGPILLFGTGGTYAEAMRDYAIGLPPLNSTLANRLMSKTKIFRVLHGSKAQVKIPIERLEQLLVTFSQLVLEQTSISEIEINPLLVSDTGLVALDARITIREGDDLVSAKPAIRPYPEEYIGAWTDRKGNEFEIRPIRPEDEPAMVVFHKSLSSTSVYQRYHAMIGLDQRVEHDRLSRMCYIDYDRQLALVIEHKNKLTGVREIVAVGRLIRERQSNEGEFALVVADDWQGSGAGSELLTRLLQYAKDTKIKRVVGEILPDNQAMLHVCADKGFAIQTDRQAHAVKAVWDNAIHA